MFGLEKCTVEQIEVVRELAKRYDLKNLYVITSNVEKDKLHLYYTRDNVLSLIEQAQFKLELAKLLHQERLFVDDMGCYSPNFFRRHFTNTQIDLLDSFFKDKINQTMQKSLERNLSPEERQSHTF